MKMPISIKIIQGLMILQIFALGISYFMISQVDPMRSSGYWANKIVYSMIDNMPQDMSTQSYILGAIQVELMIPLILTSTVFGPPITPEDVVKWGQEAVKNAEKSGLSMVEGRNSGVAENGLRFDWLVVNGKINSIYPVFD